MMEAGPTDKIDILLVDDREENLLSLEVVLTCPEYNLIKASSGTEALRYLLDHTPALILMDVQMPELSGFETAALIKKSQRTREIPIIFITAISSEEKFVHRGYDEGAVDYIYKPYDTHILRSKVAVFAEIRRQQTRVARMAALQQTATQALAETQGAQPAVLKVLKAACTTLGWDLGLYWTPDGAGALVCSGVWQHPAREARRFVEDSLRARITETSGLPGRVWEARAPAWAMDLLREEGSSRLSVAAEDGLRTAMAVPIATQGEPLGVLEFCARRKLPEDPALLQCLEAIGSQIAQVLKRTQAFERVRAAEADAQEAVRVRDEFLSIASHELKTPITALKMMIQVTQRGVKPESGMGPTPEKLAKILETSSRQVDRLTRLVEDLLDVVKIRAGKLTFNLEEVDLAEVVREVCEQYGDALSAAKCSLALQLENNVVGSWDRSRVEQIVINILSNAIKYAPGAPIVIEVNKVDAGARLQIQDQGPGIAREQQARIFERFERAISSRNITGLGLGLFIVKQIVEAHQGTIRIDSQVGKGSRFTVELPCAQPMLAAKEPSMSASLSHLSRSNVFQPAPRA